MAESSNKSSYVAQLNDALKRLKAEKYPGAEKFIEYVENYDEINKTKIRHLHVLGTPLIEITSLRIHNNNGAASGVFGTIKLIDGEGVEFNLYNRKYEDAEIVATGGPLTLTIPRGWAISASGNVRLSVHLEDKNQRTVIAEGTNCWDYETKNDYEEIQTEKFGGKCGYATLQYVTYRHAVVATVDVLVIRGKKVDSGFVDHADVFGEIIAHCGGNVTTLFSKTQNQCIRVSRKTSIDLSRHVVAVPAYSPSLVLATKLWNGDLENQIVCEDMQFFTSCWGFRTERDFEGQNGHVRVQVRWSHAYMHPAPERKLKHKIEKVSDEESMEKQKRIWVNSDQQPSTTLERTCLRGVVEQSRNDKGFLVLEVFSVLIKNDNGDKDVWGSIQFYDWDNRFDFFNKDQACTERVLLNQPLNIVAPKECLTSIDFCVSAELKDADGHIICDGDLHWGVGQLDELPFNWYDKQLCSVIRGDIGYVAVYYTILSNAVQASIRVCYSGEKPPPNVYGSIFTEYTNFKYVTRNEKEYFRSKLFRRISDNVAESSPDFDIPLSKSVVAVPRAACLIVDVDLMIGKASGDKFGEIFKDRLIFKTDVGHKRCQEIQGSRQNRVIVYVEWSEVSLHFEKETKPDDLGFRLDPIEPHLEIFF